MEPPTSREPQMIIYKIRNKQKQVKNRLKSFWKFPSPINPRVSSTFDWRAIHWIHKEILVQKTTSKQWLTLSFWKWHLARVMDHSILFVLFYYILLSHTIKEKGNDIKITAHIPFKITEWLLKLPAAKKYAARDGEGERQKKK